MLLLLLSASLSGCNFGGGGKGGGNSNASSGPTIASISVSPSTLVTVVGGSLQLTATAKDGSGNVITGLTFAWSSSAQGVATINSNGLVSGVGVGATQISVSANGFTPPTLTLSVRPVLSLNSTSLPLGALGNAYVSDGLTNSGVVGGGVGPLTWSLANGTVLPAGLTMSSNGAVSGTPTATGTVNFTLQITDSETPPVSKQANESIVVVDPVNSPCSVITNNDSGILHGSYAFFLQGFQAGTANGTPLAIAGSFTADGSGGISAGEEDINQASGHRLLTINAGSSYAVNSSGLGCVQFKYANGSAVFHFALSLALNGSSIATHGRIIEFDGYQGAQGGTATNLASGVMLLQNNSEFALASLASRFAFGEDGLDSSGRHVAVGGTFSLDTTTGSITNLAEDVDDGGMTATYTLQTGSVTSGPDSNGRAPVAVTVNGATTLLASYIVNANEMFLVSRDTLGASTPIVGGRAIVTSSSYTASSFSGNYIFHLMAIDFQGDGAACAASAPCAGVEVGAVSASSGTLTGTNFSTQAGVGQSGSVNNTYTVDSNTGRTPLSGSGKPSVLYLATPKTGTDATEPISAFVIGTDVAALFGAAEAQPAGPYVLNGNYIFATEDGGQILANFVAGYGTFTTSSGTATFNAARDIASVDGLYANVPASAIVFTINSDGTITGSTTDGATNSIQAPPGKLFWFQPAGNPPFLRVGEP